MKSHFEIEVCVDSIEAAIEAERGKADRIELCSALIEGGITPSMALISMAKQKLNIPIMVMIRPRAGDFCYSDLEFELMKKDISYCKDIGIDGVVFGILTPEGEIDKERTKELVLIAYPMKVCFHRAIDMTRDYFQAFVDIMQCKVDRVLTSGGENKAIDGAFRIAKIIEIAKLEKERKSSNKDKTNPIEIMVGSGVNPDNAEEIYNKTKATHYHFSAKTEKESLMRYRNNAVSMGGLQPELEYKIASVCAEKVLKLRETLNKLFL
jgi:copper homeostasis protein